MATVGQHLVTIAEHAEADGARLAGSIVRAAAQTALARHSAVSFSMSAQLTEAAAASSSRDARYLREAASVCRAVAGEVRRPVMATASAA